MKLDELDVVTKNTLAVQYRQEGMAVIAGVDLPDTFTPPFSDLVFLQVGANCEVYIAGSVQYQGAANAWQQAVRRRPSPGNTRKVLETRGDLFTGISKFKSLLQDAGGEYRVAATAVPVHAPAAEPQGAATAQIGRAHV